MRVADLPHNEAERLKSLYSYRILDSEPEIGYDDITRLAALICDTPVSVISLIDEKRQWFKSRFGTEVQETPRDIAFCTHALLSKEILQVEDLRLDPRFNKNPVVIHPPHVMFYAGAPLITPTGEILGTLCVLDLKTRKLTAAQLAGLKALARQVTSQLELRKQNFKISEQLHELTKTNQVVSNQQKQMIEQAKMSALGVMACGVAHEINNPLTIIKTKAYLLKEKYADGEKYEYIGKACDVITQTSDRISKIVKSLQTLSQNEEVVAVQRLPLFLLIDEALSLSSLRSSHQNIFIQCDFERFRKVFVNVNPVQFSQVLVNLFNNAFHAIANLEDKWIEVRVEVVDANVLIDIIDSGNGLSPADVPHIFEPFFTTKQVGMGTGLGLSLSRRMIEKQQGTLDYLSARENTTFRITLPQAAAN